MSATSPRVYVQTVHHKADPALPLLKKYFAPIQVGGHAGSADLGVARDDAADNIARKNASYCELTAMYWAWKNVHADYYGLMHYRRIFSARTTCFAHRVHLLKQYWNGMRECVDYKEVGTLWPANRVVTSAAELEAECRALQSFFAKNPLDWDVLLPAAVVSRNLSMARQYALTNCQCDYQIMMDCIREQFPHLEKAAADASSARVFHLYNMHVMRKPIFEEYATCLFGLLGEIERRIDLTYRNAYQRRVFGFLAERFTTIYVRHLKTKARARIVELPTVFLELN